MFQKFPLALAPLVVTAVFAAGCAHGPKADEKKEEKKADVTAAVAAPKPVKTIEAAKEVASKDFIMVNFPAGRYHLSEADKQKLAEWSVNVPKKGKVAKYEILAWPDREYPAKGKKVASKDVNLAEDRAKAVREFFKKDLITKADLKLHNMAKRPGVFSELFKTEDFDVKNTFEGTGAAPTVHNTKENKASKAIVLVKYE